MPKLRKNPLLAEQEAREAIQKEILVNRTVRGIRQYQLADLLGVSAPTLSNLLVDVDSFRAGTIRKLVKSLGISPVSILKWLGYTEAQIRSINHE